MGLLLNDNCLLSTYKVLNSSPSKDKSTFSFIYIEWKDHDHSYKLAINFNFCQNEYERWPLIASLNPSSLNQEECSRMASFTKWTSKDVSDSLHFSGTWTCCSQQWPSRLQLNFYVGLEICNYKFLIVHTNLVNNVFRGLVVHILL